MDRSWITSWFSTLDPHIQRCLCIGGGTTRRWQKMAPISTWNNWPHNTVKVNTLFYILHLQMGCGVCCVSNNSLLLSVELPLILSSSTYVIQRSFDLPLLAKGLSNYPDHDRVGEKLQECLSFAARNVPAEMENSTEIHLGGTAGLRLLQLSTVQKHQKG